MKRIALVGYGFMGRTHCAAWKKCRGARLVAVCVRHPERISQKVVGNIKGATANSSLPPQTVVYDNFDMMLAAGGFDAVDITTPTPTHADLAVRAMEAGYDVLCEKPIALTLREADRMLAVARRTGRMLCVAHCVRFFPEYAALAKIVCSGNYGKVIAADFARFMSPPRWAAGACDWLSEEKRSGGLAVDAHIHDADFILSLFGKPRQVRARTHRNAAGLVDHLCADYCYADGKLVTSDCSRAAADALLFEASARVFLERATICLQGGRLVVYPQGGKRFYPRLSKMSGYEGEVRHFLKLLNGCHLPQEALSALDAREALKLVLQLT